jgi:hypothetical protein
LRSFTRPWLRATLFCIFVCMVPSWPALTQEAAEATNPGAAVAKVCTACHGLEIVTDTPKDYDAWHDTVQEMIDRGASGTPAEFDLVMQWLYQNMATVDVNHANEDTLAVTLHASPTAVAAIVARRKSKPFKDLADLEKSVPKLDRATLDAKRGMIFFQ